MLSQKPQQKPTTTGLKAKDTKDVKDLLEGSKSKGFLTFDEVSDQLPGTETGNDQLDDVMGGLGDEDIEIVDGSAPLAALFDRPDEALSAMAARAAERVALRDEEVRTGLARILVLAP